MAAAVGMVSKRTSTSPCWDDEVDARNAEASESGEDRVGILQVSVSERHCQSKAYHIKNFTAG